ncbi:hypothetical protein DFQ27_002375, partial [Actinomortierella ambigua]
RTTVQVRDYAQAVFTMSPSQKGQREVRTLLAQGKKKETETLRDQLAAVQANSKGQNKGAAPSNFERSGPLSWSMGMEAESGYWDDEVLGSDTGGTQQLGETVSSEQSTQETPAGVSSTTSPYATRRKSH